MQDRGQRLVHSRTGRVLADQLLMPRTFVGRGIGLMFRRTLRQGMGMWIVPCSGIHTFGMRFPIDVVFLDRHLRVVRVCAGLRPWRVVPIVRSAHSALELPPGSLLELGLETGETLRLVKAPS